ncbi:hypothetical protein BT93_C2060 [Corymbia citriodora subsp. variegata]|nr:hypothetical protein BT93_C2060 [Corymbia citriodora subsp. variegata]
MAASDTGSYTMIAEATTQIVLQKLDILLSHPVHIKCLLVQARAKDAKAKLARIQEFIPSQYGPSKTTEWFARLLRTMYHAEEFIDKFHLREARERHEALHMASVPLAALISNYKLGRDLSILVNKMEELCDEKFLKEEAERKREKERASSSSQACVPWQGTKLARLTSFWDRYDPIIYFNLQSGQKVLMEWIRSPPRRTQGTSILGGSGSGKTILARWVHSQAKYMDYGKRAFVHISADMDKREFLFEILKQVEKQAREKDMDMEEIKKMLIQKLAKTERFLIVVDDVKKSNEKLLLELAMIIPFFLQGHIIYTTQDEKIAMYLNTFKKGPVRLKNLDDVKRQEFLAWQLHRERDGRRLSDEEKRILNRCPPFPRELSLLGRFLLNAGEQERAALANKDSMMTLSEILQFSCYKLPVHLKPCFIYMALFPMSFPIPTRRLVRLWLAEGLLDSHCYDREGKMTRLPEDVGETFILELADRNVIDVVSWRADGSPKACQMVVSLHEMTYRIAMSMGFLHRHATRKSKDGNNHDPTSQQQQPPAQLRERDKIRWLAEHTNIVTDIRGGSYPDSNLVHVRSFLSFHLRRGVLTKDISTFLRKMTTEKDYNLLRVLDLEGVYKPTLQGVLHKLVLLKYLGLRSTVLDSLPIAVADLHHLETLDIKHTNITSLPSSLWKARNLRHLHLNWFYIDFKNILKACSNNVNALTKLQTLSGLVIGEVKEESMTGYMNSLTTLKLFLQHSDKDTAGTKGKRIADWISFGLTNLQSLTFGVIQEAKPTEEAKPKKSQLFPVSLRVLTLSGSRVEADMMPELGGLLKQLRTFKLLANSFLGTTLRFAKDGFPSLKIFKIWKLPCLQDLIIEQRAMQHLGELEFRHLDAMKNVKGINECKELDTICVVVKKGAHGFVDHLRHGIRRRTKMYKIEDTGTPESKDNDEDDWDKRGDIFYLHIAKDGHKFLDDDNRFRKFWSWLGGRLFNVCGWRM